MAEYKIRIGNVDLVALNDGGIERDPTVTFPETSMEIWKTEYPELLNEKGHIRLRFGTTGVRSSGKLIIIDTGMQTDPGGTLLDDMKEKGVDRQAVDIVMLTHLHPDHVGWNLSDGQPTFPNARYLVPKSDWDYWTQPDVLKDAAHVQNQVLPLEKLNIMDLIEDEYEITDELTTTPTPGHTPGHVSIVVASAGEKAFILGDVAHNPAQAHHTEWNPMYDIQQERSRATRHKVFDQLEAEGTLISAGHFPDPGFGRLVRRGGRRVWQGI